MSAASDRPIYEFSGYQLDVARRQLSAPAGDTVELPSRAFDVLVFMVERPGQLLEKPMLLQAIWPHVVVEEGNLTQCIYKLRRALGGEACADRFIVTVPGRGYQFIAPVRVVGAGGVPAATDETGKAGQSDDARRLYIPTSSRSKRVWIASGVSVILLAALAGVGWWVLDEEARTGSPAPTSPPRIQTIAVIPFADLSPGRELEYFADGIAEELIIRLANVDSLRVAARTSSFASKGAQEDGRTLGEKLKVEHVLQGSVRRETRRLSISARLVRARDGSILWSHTYDRDEDELLDVQGTIAREVVNALLPTVLSLNHPDAATGEVETRNPQAYASYLRGLYYSRLPELTDASRARDEFLRAVTLDPAFARAHAHLGAAYAQMGSFAMGETHELFKAARRSIDRALELDPALGDLWWIKSNFLMHPNTPHSQYVREIERAVAAYPADSRARQALASGLMLLGRHTDALNALQEAYQTDPLWPLGIRRLAEASFEIAGDRARMLALLEEMERLVPNDPAPSQLRARLALVEGRALDWDALAARSAMLGQTDLAVQGYLALDYAGFGMFDAALHHAKACQTINPRSAAGGYNVAHVLMFEGRLQEARQVVRELIERQPRDFLAQLALAEMEYFDGNCAGSIEALLRARLPFGHLPASLNLMIDPASVPMLAWCQRKLGNHQRVEELRRAFETQIDPQWRLGPSAIDGLRVRMAAAVGDHAALLAHLTALADSPSMSFTVERHEPMIQSYLGDPQIATLLARLEARRADWRKLLPVSYVKVPVKAAGVASPARS